MKIKIHLWVASIILVAFACNTETRVENPAKLVNPFIGTDAHGHTYPGASMPLVWCSLALIPALEVGMVVQDTTIPTQ